MTSPQPGIFAEGVRHHYHLEYAVPESVAGAELAAALAPVLAGEQAAGQDVVVAFGPSLWARLRPDAVPADLEDFATIDGGRGRVAPSTQRDLWLWIQGPGPDENLRLALAVGRTLDGLATLELDLPAFQYLESRDLIGFEDGTGNPKGDDRALAALVPDGRPGAGGSIALSQRWVHDLEAFLALPVPEQERVVGRTKVDSVELEGDAMPPDSHVSRTDVKVDGVAMKVWRRSTPYGTVGEKGLHFVSFACERRRHQVQLERMYGVTVDGLHDRITDFSRAVTGSYWFAPSAQELAGVMARG